MNRCSIGSRFHGYYASKDDNWRSAKFQDSLFEREGGETTWRQPFDPQKLQCRPKKFSFGSFNDVVQRTKITEPISGQKSKAVDIKKHHRIDESQTPINHANRNETLITIIKSSNSCAQTGLKRHVSFTGPTDINKKCKANGTTKQNTLSKTTQKT